MRARIWGCRGSIAAPGPETVRYGGNTSCVEVQGDDGHVIVLDAGTGARPLGEALMRASASRIDILLTHLHVDHVEGLGLFAPIWSSKTELHIWGPPSPVASLDERLATYFSPPLFPVHLSEVPARVSFHDAPREPWTIGTMRLTSHPILHPGPTVGYRLEHGGRTLAYVTDHEPGLGTDLLEVGTEWISGFALAYRADLLVHDCQYTDEEYRDHVGWGHASVSHVAAFARRAEVDRLVLFHHHPDRDDDGLDAMRKSMLDAWPVAVDRCIVAAEGADVEV